MYSDLIERHGLSFFHNLFFFSHFLCPRLDFLFATTGSDFVELVFFLTNVITTPYGLIIYKYSGVPLFDY